MHELCHRCGAELPTGDFAPPFCAQCGAPQLLLSDYSEPISTSERASTGALPPPHPGSGVARSPAVDWQTAIRCTVLVSAIGAVLGLIGTRVDILSPISTIWVLSASLTTLALYQRRRPLATMNAAIGARIGVLVGTILAAFLAVATVAGALIARFGLHATAAFDAEFARSMQAQVAAQAAQLAAAQTPLSVASIAFLNSPEFRTTMMLLGIGMIFSLLFVVSICGGAFGGFLRARRRTAA